VYGIFGIEVSTMLFKRLYSPNNTKYPHVFSSLAPVAGDVLDTGAGLMAGNSYLTSQTIGFLTGERGQSRESAGVVSYRSQDGGTYMGHSEILRLYPTGSPYETETWALALLMPDGDWSAVVGRNNIVLYGSIILLLAISLASAVIISRRYIRPWATVLEKIRSDSRMDLPRTRIAEIDDLLEFLAALDEERKTLGEEVESLTAELERSRRQPVALEDTAPDLTDYGQFLENLKTLTMTERAVFNLYTKGKTVRQIADALFISDNTVKFHNKNIYKKIGVSSLKALKVFINMMR
jgi:DNA-binding CsgD family transcriptional regulator